jgi:hypothetical protein
VSACQVVSAAVFGDLFVQMPYPSVKTVRLRCTMALAKLLPRSLTLRLETSTVRCGCRRDRSLKRDGECEEKGASE